MTRIVIPNSATHDWFESTLAGLESELSSLRSSRAPPDQIQALQAEISRIQSAHREQRKQAFLIALTAALLVLLLYIAFVWMDLENPLVAVMEALEETRKERAQLYNGEL